MICKQYNLVGEYGALPDSLIKNLPKNFVKFKNGFYTSHRDKISFFIRRKGRAIVSWDCGKIVGICVFSPSKTGHRSFITWVDKDYRKSGIAYKLWAKALNREHNEPIKIEVNAGTLAGEKFIKKLKRKYPQHVWKTNF